MTRLYPKNSMSSTEAEIAYHASIGSSSKCSRPACWLRAEVILVALDDTGQPDPRGLQEILCPKCADVARAVYDHLQEAGIIAGRSERGILSGDAA